MMSDKIRQHHLDRRAILYVRQSSSHQVLHNRESRALQYAMRDRLTALGWSEIEIIDDDLGRSAAGGVIRAGFERMVAEVVDDPLNQLDPDSFVTQGLVPANLKTAIVKQTDFDHAFEELQLSPAGDRTWQAQWRKFTSGA